MMKSRINIILGRFFLPCLIIAVILSAGCTCKLAPETSPAGFINMLAAVPDSEDTRAYVAVNDYCKARQQIGLELLPVGSSTEELIDYEIALQSGGVLESGPEFPGAEDFWGYSLRDVDRDMRAGLVPSASAVRVLWGEFDESVIWSVLQGRGYERQSYLDYPVIYWGDDLERKPDESPGSAIAHRIAVTQERLIMSGVMDNMKRALDIIGKADDSLAGNVDFVALAESLNNADAYTGLLTDNKRNLSEVAETFELYPDQVEELAQDTLQEYRVWGLGINRQAEQYYLYIFVCYDSDTAAEKDTPKLSARLENGRSFIRWGSPPWTDFFSTIEVSAEGRVVHAKMSVDSARSGIDMFYSGEFHLILAYE